MPKLALHSNHSTMTQATQSPAPDDRQYDYPKVRIYSILGDTEHRIILRVLADADEPLSLKELTRATLLDEEFDQEISTSVLRGLMLDIYLPVLESAGVIDTDVGYNKIAPGEHHEGYLEIATAVDDLYDSHFGGR